jgi:polyribonucleotide nucleotidyltransferase
MNVTINAMKASRGRDNGRGVLAKRAIGGINEQCAYREQVIS